MQPTETAIPITRQTTAATADKTAKAKAKPTGSMGAQGIERIASKTQHSRCVALHHHQQHRAPMSSAALQFDTEAHPKARISRKVRDAIRYMVEEGLSRPDAAQKANLTDHGLYQALRNPLVLAYRRELLEVLRTSEAARCIARGAKLADAAQSESVRNDANKWLAGLDGLSPITKTETVNTHRHLLPGLVIVRAPLPAPGDDARVIGGQAHETRKTKPIRMIGQSVPHPTMGNAHADDTNRAVIDVPAQGDPGGQK